jgi:ABC-type antimicrobial peptide transport system ATPase subunit
LRLVGCQSRYRSRRKAADLGERRNVCRADRDRVGCLDHCHLIGRQYVDLRRGQRNKLRRRQRHNLRRRQRLGLIRRQGCY